MKIEDKIDLYLKESYSLNENWVKDMVKKVTQFSSKKAKDIFRKHWDKLKETVRKQGVEKEFLNILKKHLNIRANSLEDLDRKSVKESYVNEDFAHYWKWLKDNAFPTFLIFPGLQIFFQLDELIDGNTPDFKRMIVYGIFWLIVATGSHITQWKKWKEENPEEWEEEGEPGPFTISSIGRG